MGSIDRACISGFLCRLCSEMHRIVIHIYGDQGRKLCLVEKINGYLPITISPTDPLPKTICETCLRRVEQHYDLLMRLTRIKQGNFPKIKKPFLPITATLYYIRKCAQRVARKLKDIRRA
uniref:ZAD domain-containing protein n=1 Tax=Bactrocera latifrons TaxID=174628 RepID=A0A0K8UAK5_BACLA